MYRSSLLILLLLATPSWALPLQPSGGGTGCNNPTYLKKVDGEICNVSDVAGDCHPGGLLESAAAVGSVCVVTNSATSSSCEGGAYTGGQIVVCVNNGTNWVALASSEGGGIDNAFFKVKDPDSPGTATYDDTGDVQASSSDTLNIENGLGIEVDFKTDNPKGIRISQKEFGVSAIGSVGVSGGRFTSAGQSFFSPTMFGIDDENTWDTDISELSSFFQGQRILVKSLSCQFSDKGTRSRYPNADISDCYGRLALCRGSFPAGSSNPSWADCVTTETNPIYIDDIGKEQVTLSHAATSDGLEVGAISAVGTNNANRYATWMAQTAPSAGWSGGGSCSGSQRQFGDFRCIFRYEIVETADD